MIRLLSPALPILLLVACGNPAADNGDGTQPTDLQGDPGQSPLPAPPPSDGSLDGVNDGYPDLTPPPLTAEAQQSETGARSVLGNWARAIELKEFDQAWRMLDERDQRKWDRATFADLFTDLGEITVAVPSGTMEGAAGSSYYTAPVTITADDTAGRPVRYDGQMVLRRANDVPGATADQLRWHIDSLKLDWAH